MSDFSFSVHLLDVSDETFQELTEDDDRLPFPTYLQFFNVNSQLYGVTKDKILLKCVSGYTEPFSYEYVPVYFKTSMLLPGILRMAIHAGQS